MSTQRIRFGSWGEKIAAQYLVTLGYQILTRNFRTPFGEIDLVAEFEGEIVFVEVKTRSSNRFGYPEDAITSKKILAIVQSAEFYLTAQTNEYIGWRVDVIAISVRGRQTPMINHFENAV